MARATIAPSSARGAAPEHAGRDDDQLSRGRSARGVAARTSSSRGCPLDAPRGGLPRTSQSTQHTQQRERRRGAGVTRHAWGYRPRRTVLRRPSSPRSRSRWSRPLRPSLAPVGRVATPCALRSRWSLRPSAPRGAATNGSVVVAPCSVFALLADRVWSGALSSRAGRRDTSSRTVVGMRSRRSRPLAAVAPRSLRFVGVPRGREAFRARARARGQVTFV